MTERSNSPSSPLDALWLTPAIVLTVLAGEALALIIALAPGASGQSRLVTFGLASLAIQWITMLTLGSTYLMRRPLARLPVARMAWLMIALLLASTSFVGAAAWFTVGAGMYPEDSWLAFLLRLSAIAVIVGLFGLIAFQNYWQAKQHARRAQQSELEALHARIRPHFLFNTLNTGAALIRGRPETAEKVLLDLADLFRAALNGPREISLREELDLTRRYLDIEALRFRDRLHVEWLLPEPLPDVMLPSLTIQPLAENAIRHGIEPLPGGGRIEIKVEPLAGSVRVIVSNDVPESATDSTSGHNVGLHSTRARLQAMGNGSRVETQNAPGSYIATLVIPASRQQA